MKRLSPAQTITVGIALFTMFFGAGNLIFPPMLSYEAGPATPAAFVGFIASAIGLPVLGVMAVAKAGELPTLAGNVGPRFSRLFTLAVVLAIGPLLAIPRTASTSFSMVAQAFDGSGTDPLVQLAYTAVFFGVAFVLALRPTRITAFLGKVSGPILLVLVAALVIGTQGVQPVVTDNPVLRPEDITGAYTQQPVIAGFLAGYQTMDALAALLFGAVIAMNIRGLGVDDPDDVARATSKSGLIMGVVMAVVYLGLASLGPWARSGIPVSDDVTGATILSLAAGAGFGDAGSLVVGAIFVLACLNVCCGLLCTVAEHFEIESPRFGYRTWLIAFTVVSFALANFGLAAILRFSLPLLEALYPLAIVLIVLGLATRFTKRFPGVWLWSCIFCGTTSILLVICGLVWPDAATAPAALNYWPLYSQGLGWVLPTLVGVGVGMAASSRKPA